MKNTLILKDKKEEFENMKTVLINQPGEIKVTEIPMPEVKEGEALLKIRYGGI